MGSIPLALKTHVVGPTRPRRGIKNPKGPPELFKIQCRSVVTNQIPNANNTVEFSLTFRTETQSEKEHVRTRWRKENNLRWSRRPCAMEPKGEESLDLVTRKDFFEEKQLVILRGQH
ncbi:hypothetical protein NDU88_007308 [Pleurodeles waltl]|uniref:Uncharacterized protein n=1 Tax=Pleurodeles waltl TaxID=8319 RepID=A0AAV7NVK5_PLEWA|nr:hypothetical protein NDU88_007308 [Pleurodeles waltl]